MDVGAVTQFAWIGRAILIVLFLVIEEDDVAPSIVGARTTDAAAEKKAPLE